MQANEFSKYTYKIIKKLPHWFNVRKNPEVTTSGNFLNIMGITFEELELIIDYIYKQNNLISADEKELNYVYKGFIPSIIKNSTLLEITSDNEILEEIIDVKEFFKVSNEAVQFPELKIDNPFYIDFSNNVIYTKKFYDGKIYLSTSGNSVEIKLKEHKVWNIFDEFGYWFGLERNPGENNYNYKERLLDIFKNKANSSGKGLANALARELNLRKKRTWEDGSKDLILKEPMILYNQIKVDGEILPEDKIKTNREYDVILKGDDQYKGRQREVSFIAGIEIKELNNEQDTTMYHRLHTVEGTPSKLKEEYAQKINETVPLLFDTTQVDVNTWDIGSVENTDKGVLESITDIPIEPFIKYGVIEKEFIDNVDKNYEINTWGDIKNMGTWEDVKNSLKTWKDVLISEK